MSVSFVPAKKSRFNTSKAIVAAQKVTGCSYEERFAFVVSQINKAADLGKYSVIIHYSSCPNVVCNTMREELTAADYTVSDHFSDVVIYW